MDSEQKDFKAVKVQMKSSQKSGETLSRSMLYSGINIFGQLSQLYLQNKESGGSYSDFQAQVQPKQSIQTDAGEGKGSMMHLSQDVLAIFKRLQKKDSTTKIKAFVELDKYLESIDASLFSQQDSDSDELQNLLTFFLYHFCRIVMNEPDKKVREAAHQSFSLFIKKARRRIGPHLKKIFSVWFCSFFDVSQEVASIAKKNFEQTFPENKREQVFKIAYKNFLHFANEQLKQSEDQINDSAADLSKSQREDVFDRITSSVLQALAQSFSFTKSWSEEEQQHFQKKLIDILDLNVSIQDTTSDQVKDKKQIQAKKPQSQSYLFGFLQSNYRGRVRSSCLQFISNLLLNLPHDVVQHHINQLSPLVYKLVGEDNSNLQTTLWREAIFTLGKNFPQSWETINIKKDFLPKLYNSLKNSGYGAPVALYENFIKFASIFPFYHLVDYVEDKVNKASFKERCNLTREAFTTMYQGLKNDESVAFHQDLTKSYYETLSFILWKRVQPLIQKDSVSKEDKDFSLEQIKKTIQVPVEDYINNFEKFQSRVQNQRNIRYTIPTQLNKMLIDLAERNLDPIIYQSLISNLWDSVILSIEKQNTIRLVSALLKNQSKADNNYFKENILRDLIIKLIDLLISKLGEDIENLNKETIDNLSKKAQNLARIIYKLNKRQITLDEEQIKASRLNDLLASIIKKEELAKNVLSQDMLAKFQIIKDNFVKIIILTSNIQKSKSSHEFIEKALNTYPLDINTRNKVLMPQSEYKKLDFKNYYVLLQSDCHQVVIDFLTSKIINDQSQISQNHLLIDQGISKVNDNLPSFLVQEDLPLISTQVVKIIREIKNNIQIVTFYFQSVKSLLNQTSTSQYDELKQLLFDILLTLKTRHASYHQLWTLFEQTLKAHINSKNTVFFDYCQNKLKHELHNIIHQNSNYDIDTFNRFTHIVKAFVQMCSNKQQIIEEILLQEENFTNLENNSLPLKMFRDLFLSGGVAFDVTKLFTQDSKYVWLTSALLNSRHLPSLANYIQLKKQLLIFVDTEVIPSLIYQAQNGNEKFVLEMCEHMSELAQTRIDYVYTVDYLVKKMIDPGEDFPAAEKPVLKVDEFKKIFKLVSKNIIQVFISDQPISYNLNSLLFIKMLKQLAYFIVDEQDSVELFKKANQVLTQFLAVKSIKFNAQFGITLEIYSCLLEYLESEKDVELSQQLLIHLLDNSSELSNNDVNVLNAVLQYAANMLSRLGVSKFNALVSQKADFQSFISQMIEIQTHQHIQPITYINLLSIIRKTIGTELITDKQLLIDQVIEIAKEHALSFEIKIQKIQDNLNQDYQAEDSKQDSQSEQDDSQIENFEFEMLQELAETLLIFPSYLNASLEENNLYILISSGVESLQKAAFVLLKYLYENFIPQIRFFFDDDDVMKQLKIERDEAEKLQEREAISQDQEEEKHKENAAQQKYKNKLAFKNISEILIEMLENPPNIASHDDDQKQIVSSNANIESIIFGDSKEGCMNNKVFGYFLAWNAILIKIENGRIKSQLQQISDYATVLGALNEYLEENYDVYHMLLVSLIAYLPDYKKGLQEAFNVSTFEPEYLDLSEQKQNVLFTVYTLINFMKSFPSLARKYYQECEKQLLDIVMPYIKQIVSPAILDNEIKKIEVAQSQLGTNELTFALFKTTKEILASYSKGEIEMTLKIKIPADYPLKLVEVDVSKQIKISEKQMRKWILSIRKILQFQNGDIISAVLQWKNNIEKEIEGIEDCYICYCVVHEGDQSLPKMPCKTCKNKFHVACIRKWFRTSNKSNCPICQNYFF